MIQSMSPAQFASHDLAGALEGSPQDKIRQWRDVGNLVFKEDMSKEEAFIALLGLLSDLKHDDPIFSTDLKPLTHTNFTLCADGIASRLSDFGLHTFEEDEDKSEAMTAEESFKLICSMAFAYRGAAAKTVEAHKRFLSVISEWDGCAVQRWRPNK